MRELRFAVRHLIRRPGFSVIAILTLALGIGANAAVFSVSHAVLLAPLPYERPEQIVILNERTPQFPQGSVTRYNYDDWRARAKSFSGMGAFRPLNMTVSGAGDPERVPVKMITANLLPLLGVHIQHGRNFTGDEDQPGADDVAMVGAGFAARRFAGIDAVGEVVHLDNKPYTIVGVMPSHFELFQPADVYVPFGPWAATLPEDRGWHPGIFPIARLKGGVSIDDARVEMDAICQALEAALPESNRNVRALVTRAQDLVVQNVRPALLLLSVAVAVVLLIDGADLYIPPRKGGKHALRIVREVLARGQGVALGPAKRELMPQFVRKWFKKLVDKTKPSSEARRSTSISAALEFCRQVLPRRAVLFLISDFLDDGYIQVLRHANRKHDVVAALITDQREADMPPAGLVTLEDAETGTTRLVDTRSKAFRDDLAARAATRQKDLHDQLRATGMDLVVFDAAGSMVDPLLKFFRERERRLRR